MPRLAEIWHWLNLPCEEVARLASESFDRDLSRWESIALRSHVIYCTACRRYREQVAILRRALQRLTASLETDPPAPSPLPGLPDDARARIQEALRKH
jgi:predicted anti-sigma-YlaC factor YlaD